MSTLLLAAFLSLAPADEAAAAPKLDGNWLIVYAEENSRRNNAWEQRVATMKGDTMTYEDAGKQHTVKLKFGPHQTVEATRTGEAGGEGKTLRGVFVAAQDYVTISLEAPAGRKAAAQGRTSSGDFILILRKQAAKPQR